MNTQFLSPAARQVESRLKSDNLSNLDAFTREFAVHRIEEKGYSASDYIFTAERRNELAGNKTLGSKRLDLGSYSESDLYGASGSPVPRFRLAISNLASKAERVASLWDNETEYAHQAALFWADVGRLKEFLSLSPIVAEIVAELRTARFQVLGKDTPLEFIKAIASALSLAAKAARFDAELIDKMVETMEQGGFDSLAPIESLQGNV
jgi:hypothetical protein